MGKLESTIKSEIQRLAKRQIRSTFIPLRHEVRGMRLRLSNLTKNFCLGPAGKRAAAEGAEERIGG
jgi:hypothetical protein